MSNKKVIGFCQECGKEFNSENDIYSISFVSPAGLMGDLMGNGTTKIKFCSEHYESIFSHTKKLIRRGDSR